MSEYEVIVSVLRRLSDTEIYEQVTPIGFYVEATSGNGNVSFEFNADGRAISMDCSC